MRGVIARVAKERLIVLDLFRRNDENRMFPGELGDLHVLDPATMTWSALHAMGGTEPLPRSLHGFAALGGKLFVYGGADAIGM